MWSLSDTYFGQNTDSPAIGYSGHTTKQYQIVFCLSLSLVLEFLFQFFIILRKERIAVTALGTLSLYPTLELLFSISLSNPWSYYCRNCSSAVSHMSILGSRKWGVPFCKTFVYSMSPRPWPPRQYLINTIVLTLICAELPRIIRSITPYCSAPCPSLFPSCSQIMPLKNILGSTAGSAMTHHRQPTGLQE